MNPDGFVDGLARWQQSDVPGWKVSTLVFDTFVASTFWNGQEGKGMMMLQGRHEIKPGGCVQTATLRLLETMTTQILDDIIGAVGTIHQ